MYPKTRATLLAKQTSKPVLSMPDQQPTVAAQIKQTPVKAVTPGGEEIEIAEIVASAPVEVPTEASQGPLPKTSSNLPLLGLVALLSLAAGVVLRMAARWVN